MNRSSGKGRRLATAVLAITCIAAIPAVSQELVRNVTAQLSAEGASAEFTDFISGFESVDYQIALRAGQRLSVQLSSTNLSNSFDVYAPDAEKPQYESGVSGNRHELVAAADGKYRIRVYLLRLAARDGQEAEFTLALARPES